MRHSLWNKMPLLDMIYNKTMSRLVEFAPIGSYGVFDGTSYIPEKEIPAALFTYAPNILLNCVNPYFNQGPQHVFPRKSAIGVVEIRCTPAVTRNVRRTHHVPIKYVLCIQTSKIWTYFNISWVTYLIFYLQNYNAANMAQLVYQLLP